MRNTVEIYLKPYNVGAKAIINKNKYKKVMDVSPVWYLHQPNGDNYQSYARAEVWKNGKRKRYYLHRVVSNAKKGQIIDHINHNGLDCTNTNLRFVTTSENAINRKTIQPNNTSGYTGVGFHKSRNKWRAYIQYHNRFIHIGYFDTKEEAALAYNSKALELFGEIAITNILTKA